MDAPSTTRAPWFRWYVCGLLLLATTINYMDRQTLSNAAPRVTSEFGLNNEQYGNIETAFGLAFAGGALVFGCLADVVRIRWLYPLVLLAWSAMGIATGWATNYSELMICRTLLGFFEAGHWPCALRTTQRLLAANERTMGNSILQSGSSIGAILTPLVMARLLTDEPGSWRFAFQIVGAIGAAWVVLWLTALRDSDLSLPTDGSSSASDAQQPQTLQSWIRRFIVLIVVVVSINACWHLFRVWMVMFLVRGHGFAEPFALKFSSAF